MFYGFDILSLFLLLLSSLLSLSRYTSGLSILILIIIFFRAFSRNTYKRTNELNKFIGFVNKLLAKFGKQLPYNLPKLTFDSFITSINTLKNNFKQRREYNKKYKIVKCPKCKQKLRLPRGKGGMTVTCKKCSHEFHLRT